MARKPVERRDDDGNLLYRIDPKTMQGTYYVQKGMGRGGQSAFLSEIALRGFDSLPSGLYTNGFGLTGSGYPLLKQLHEKYGPRLRVVITNNSPSNVGNQGSATTVTINHDDLRRINELVRDIKSQRREEIDSTVAKFLGHTFPKEFDAPEGSYGTYRPGTLARLLDTPDLVDSLSDQDAKALQQFYPRFIKGLDFSVRSTKNMRLVAEGMEATRTVYLDKVIKEFEKKLSGSSNEHTWQKFLRQHILLLLNTYAAVIEKQSVDLDGKYPDFMLIDAYGYLDIYEIKKPQTRVLKLDKSRENYYWDAEVAKAISQVENYADSTRNHHLELAQKVLRKDGREVRIVRPRGYIIAGRRSDLNAKPEMEEDFRLLNDSLKNVDVIFYDDLLDNVKALYDRLTSPDVTTKPAKKSKRTKKTSSK